MAFVYISFMTAFTQYLQSWVVASETTWPAKPKSIFCLALFRRGLMVPDRCNHKTLCKIQKRELRLRCQIPYLIQFLLVLQYHKCHDVLLHKMLDWIFSNKSRSVVCIEWVRYVFNSSNPLSFILYHIWSLTFPLRNCTRTLIDEKFDIKQL
jgi:hypothetical protein